jgi:hypothetical protein
MNSRMAARPRTGGALGGIKTASSAYAAATASMSPAMKPATKPSLTALIAARLASDGAAGAAVVEGWHAAVRRRANEASTKRRTFIFGSNEWG